MSESTSPVRVAVVQCDPQVGTQNRAANLSNSLELALQAVNGGANLIVLPELTNTGYFFRTRQDAFDHAESVPDGPSVSRWEDFARQHQVYLVAGLTEREGHGCTTQPCCWDLTVSSANTARRTCGIWRSSGSLQAIAVSRCSKRRSVASVC